MVFQGTVLGPSLWNVMYEDTRIPMNQQRYTEVVYADGAICATQHEE